MSETTSESVDDILELRRRIALGDDDAARRLVNFGTPLVLAICRAHRPRQVAVEDLAQEVFLTMFVRLDRYEVRPGVPFSAWLSRLAVNVCLDVLRAEARRPRLSFGQEASLWLASLVGAPSPHQEATDDAQAAKEVVDALLAELSAADRLVLTLLDLEEKSVAEVASLTGWSASATKVRAFRARGRLQIIAERWRSTQQGRS